MSKNTDHDQIFKTLLKEFFSEFIELFLPHVASEIDFDSVEFLEQEFFTDINNGRKRLLDLVAKVKLKNGGEEYILIHTELESTKPNSKEFPARMFKYFCQLFLRFGKPVIPIVVFTDDHKWRTNVPDTFSISFNDKEYLRYCYHSIKLKRYNWADFLKQSNPLAFALMAKMDYSKADRVKLKADFLRLILKADFNKARQSMLLEFVENYIKLSKNEQSDFEELIDKKEYVEVAKMVTVYEERGINNGIEQGMQKGMQKTAHDAVLEVLEVRFGDVPLWVRDKIENCLDLIKLKQYHRSSILIESIDAFRSL